ncbi:MAG TPA: hypothetical protein VIC55_05795 [Gemmatimonadaceae bacterium]
MIETVPSRVPTGTAGETSPFDTAWTNVRDALLCGLTHSLSNRVMAIATLAELASGPTPEPRAGEVLSAESHRLDALLRQFRMLCATDPAQCEPVHLGDLLPSLVALSTRHPEATDLPCELDVDTGAQPAWGDPACIQRVVLTLIVAATRAARRMAVPVVRLRVWGDDRTTIVSACVERGGAGRAEPTRVQPVPAPGTHPIRIIEPLDGGVRYELILPALVEARRRGV